MTPRRRAILRDAAVIAGLYAADQATKALVVARFQLGDSVAVVPGFFNLVRVHNTGAAFGMLRDNNTFFIGLSLAALAVMAVLAWKGAFSHGLSRAAAVLLAAGVLGNLTDRLLHGHVIDFLDVILPWYGHWPAFNIADSCICAAAGLLILGSFLPGRPAPSAP